MYLPPAFQQDHLQLSLELIHEHPFATLITQEGGLPFVNHLPVISVIDKQTQGPGSIRLIGHMSRSNPQWRHLEKGQEVTAVFHGPHAYVTPTWYPNGGVPTWNYAVVHAQGRARIVQDFKGLVRILQAMSERFEGGAGAGWRFTLPEDLRSPQELTAAIVGFELEAPKLVAKFKMSQNRSPADRDGVLAGLQTRPDQGSRATLALMKRLAEERRPAPSENDQ